MFKITTLFQRMQSNHNNAPSAYFCNIVQNYHIISKNAIKSQPIGKCQLKMFGSKLPHYFKECNQITTGEISMSEISQFKITTLFQRMQSNHNTPLILLNRFLVQNYHIISKNAIKSQLECPLPCEFLSSKLPHYFKECNQITTSA